MSNNYWKLPRDGNWTDAANWTAGAPDSGEDIYLTGAKPYTVTLSTATSIAALHINGASFVETAAGSLAASGIDVTNGTVELDGGNSSLTGTIAVRGSRLILGNAGAIGSAAVSLTATGGGSTARTASLETRVTMTLATALDGGYGADVGATTGTMLTLTGRFGLAGGSFGSDVLAGTIVFAPSSANVSMFGYTIGGGTLVLGNALAASLVGGDGGTVAIAAGATLELNGQADSFGQPYNGFGRLQDFGTLTNQGALATATFLVPVDGNGTIAGNLVLAARGSSDSNLISFGGTVALTGQGGITVADGISFDLATVSVGATGSITIGSASHASNYASAVLGLSGAIAIDCPIVMNNAELVLSGHGVIRQSIQGTGTVDVIGAGRIELDGDGSNALYGYANGTTMLILGGANIFSSLDIVASAVTCKVVIDIPKMVRLESGIIVVADTGTTYADITTQGPGTIAAMTGKTLTLAGGLHDDGLLVIFGTAGAAGTVVLAGTLDGYGYPIEVGGGTLRLGAGFQNGSFGTPTFIVDAGARFDLGGYREAASGQMAGTIVSSVAGGSILFDGIDVTGKILGAVAVEIGVGTDSVSPTTVFEANGSYTGDTTIDVGAILSLGIGGTAGSIGGGRLIDNGTLVVDRSDTTTLAYAITGSGAFEQDGTGTTKLTGANSYTGQTIVTAGTLYVSGSGTLGTDAIRIEGGVLSVADAAALRNDVISIESGELLLRSTMTLDNAIVVAAGSSTIAAAHGATVTIAGSFETDIGPAFNFGAAGADGTIVLAPDMAAPGTAEIFHVAAGTLVVGSAGGSQILSDSAGYVIDAGATLDLNGYGLETEGPPGLSGSGTLTDGGAAATLTLVHGGSFDGTVRGAITIEAEGALTLGGTGTFDLLRIAPHVTATLLGSASEAILFEGAGAKLVLGRNAALSGIVSGFATGGSIDLRSVAFDSQTKARFDTATHVLSVSDGSHKVGIALSGDFGGGKFKLSDDGHGETLVKFVAKGAAAVEPAFDQVAARAFGHDDGMAAAHRPGPIEYHPLDLHQFFHAMV